MSGHRIGLRMEAETYTAIGCVECVAVRPRCQPVSTRAGSVNEIAELREKVAVSTTTPQVKIALELLLHADVLPHSFRATASALLNEHGYLPDVIVSGSSRNQEPHWRSCERQPYDVFVRTAADGARVRRGHAVDGTLKWTTRSNSEQNEVCKSARLRRRPRMTVPSMKVANVIRKMVVGGRLRVSAAERGDGALADGEEIYHRLAGYGPRREAVQPCAAKARFLSADGALGQFGYPARKCSSSGSNFCPQNWIEYAKVGGIHARSHPLPTEAVVGQIGIHERLPGTSAPCSQCSRRFWSESSPRSCAHGCASNRWSTIHEGRCIDDR